MVPNAVVKALATPAQEVPSGIRRVRADVASRKGTGVHVAIIDTGIDTSHPDLAANIAGGFNCSDGPSAAFQDGNAHGTHVAGTVAALDNSLGVVGVAPQAKLWAVRVLDDFGSGSDASVICGIDFVTSKGPANGGPIKVANMSLGRRGVADKACGTQNNDPMHAAICRSRDAGVTYVVAAGNSASDASTFVPAAYDDAVITVSALADSDGAPLSAGAVTEHAADDTFALFSNFGSVVDLAAPGAAILSTSPAAKYRTLSGTSMASPHVAGAAALFIQVNPTATFQQVRDGLKARGERLGQGHTDPFSLDFEPVLQVNGI